MKKSFYITSLLLLIGQFCLAQLNATLNMSFNPSPKILEWASNPQTVTLTVSNSSSNMIDYKIKATVIKDGNLVAQTKLTMLSTLSIDGGGFESYFVDDIIPSSALDIVDQSISRTVIQTGKLPGGNYMFCVELVDPITSALLSTKQCQPFRITDYQPSRLTLPLHKSAIVPNNAVQFSWTPVQPATVVTYYFRMVEIRDGQNAFSAFTENQSFVETELTGQTMLIYTSDFPVLEEGKSYIWSVQAEDMNGDIVAEDNGFNGWAELFVLSVSKNEDLSEDDDKRGENQKKSANRNSSNICDFELMSLSDINTWIDQNTLDVQIFISPYNLVMSDYTIDSVSIDWGIDGLEIITAPTSYSISHQYNLSENPPTSTIVKYKAYIRHNATGLICEKSNEKSVNLKYWKNCDGNNMMLDFTYKIEDGKLKLSSSYNDTEYDVKNYIWHINSPVHQENRIEGRNKRKIELELTEDVSLISVRLWVKYEYERKVTSRNRKNKKVTKYKTTNCNSDVAKIIDLGDDKTDSPCEKGNLSFAYYRNSDVSISVKNKSQLEDLNQTISSYFWDMGDGTIYKNIDSLQHIYDDNGNYNICLKYLIENEGSTDTCTECKLINIRFDCNAEVNFSKSKDGYNYTFDANVSPLNGATLDSIVWFVDDERMENGNDTLLTVTSTRNKEYEVCLVAYVTNADNTTCTVIKCRDIKLEGCAFEECIVSCDAVSTATFAEGSIIQLCGGLEMELTAAPSGSPSSLSGKGKVYIPWLLTDVAVEFSGIKINDQGFLCDGQIWAEQHETAPTYPQQWGINAVGGFVIGDPFLKDIETWIYNTSTQVVDLNQQISSQMNPVKVPLGVNNAEGYTLAMSAFQFTPTRNKFSAMAIIPVDFYDDHTLGFEATEITFTSDGPISPLAPGGSGGLEIIAPKTIYYTTQSGGDTLDKFAITFHKKGNGHLGTGFDFTNPCGTGLNWCFRVDADVEMPRKWVTPIPDLNNKVSSNIRTEVCNWTDWLVSVDLPKCELTGSNGFELEVTDFTLDFSSVRNQPGMAFPAYWQGDETESFKGFWMKQAKLIFPDDFTTFADTTRRLETQLNNWIIHKQEGITGELRALNVINFPEGNIADLGASIDELKLNIVNSSFTEAYIKGQLLLPITDSSSSNAINYTALFGTGNQNSFDGFQFNMEPNGTIKSEFFAGADLEIYQTSYLELLLSDGSTSFDIILNGMIDLPDQINNPINNQDIPIDFNTTFEGLGMKYSKNGSTKTFTFEQGEWAFASPSKKLYNFPISIENFKPIVKLPQGTEMCTGGMSFDAIINLASKKIGGRTTIDIIGAINKPDGERLQPVFKEVNLSSVSIYADLAAIKMNGTIDFISNDPIYGDGVQGNIDARFNSINTSVAAAAFFGTSSYNSAGKYRYWKVEAQATLPPPGIPFLPGVVFRGFGAGAYHHMKAEFTNSPLSVSGSSSSPLFSGATFTPDPSISFGFKAKAIVATSPKEESFNGDVGLFGEFASTGGMTYIGFDGNFWLGAGFDKRQDAITNGSVLATYDFPSKIFDLGAQVRINRDPISTPGDPLTLALHIDGKDNKWYFKLGEPNHLNTVRIAGVNVEQYLMFGNDIYSPPGFMSTTLTGYSNATEGGSPSIGGVAGQTVNGNTESGKGFAFGIGANFSDAGYKQLWPNRLKASYAYDIGAEVNGSLMQYANNASCPGLQGWRMKGGICAYAGITAGIKLDPCSGKCRNCLWVYCNGKSIDLVGLGVGAWLSGEFPKPTYLAGGIDAYYEFLGMWTGTFRADFQVGNRCGGTALTGGASFVQEDSPEEQRRQLISLILPDNGARVDTSTTITAVYGFTPSETFEAAEVQSDGSIKNRTFQARYQAKLYEKNEVGEWVELGLTENVNSIGEHIFYHKPFSLTVGNVRDVRAVMVDNIGVYNPDGAPNRDAALGRSSFGSIRLNPQGAIRRSNIGGTSSSSQSYGFGIGSTQGSITDGVNTALADNPDDYADIAEGDERPVSILKSATAYKFVLEATLWELVNENWVVAKNKDLQPVVETETVMFYTTGYNPTLVRDTGSLNGVRRINSNR